MASDIKLSCDSDHKIHKNDPLAQRNLINNVVEVTRVDGQKIQGTVFTIDPVSESIVLVSTVSEGHHAMDIVMGHAVRSVDVIADQPPASIDALFPTSNPAASMSELTITALRSKLKAWLQKNYLPVEEDGDVLSLRNALKIYPPYTADQCISENEIILGKVQHLISTIPQSS